MTTDVQGVATVRRALWGAGHPKMAFFPDGPGRWAVLPKHDDVAEQVADAIRGSPGITSVTVERATKERAPRVVVTT